MVSGFLPTLNFALEITAPIFILVTLGIVLRRVNLIDQGFIKTASFLVFTVGLPTLLFMTIVRADMAEVLSGKLIAVGLVGTVLVFLLFMLLAPLLVAEPRERGIFVQGAFRGNMGIVGLAFCLNAYGEKGLATASIYMALLTILYNILAVYILTHSLQRNQQQSFISNVLGNIAKNPIVIAICLALAVSALHIPIHPIVMQTGDYLSAMTLPVALICIGGSISLRELHRSSNTAFITTALKLCAAPTVMVLLALPFGFAPMELGVLFLMAAAPTATASYIMVQAMNGNGVLAANIVVLSTLGSIVTVSVGIVILRSLQLI